MSGPSYFLLACCLGLALLPAVLGVALEVEAPLSEVLKTECHADFYCEPKCLDRPEGYYCECGPGFFWNSHSCVSQAVDSSMVFANRANASYAVINNRTRILPTLHNFTIAMFLKLYHLNETGTLFSFRKDSHGNFVRLWYSTGDRQFHIEAHAEQQIGHLTERPAFTYAFPVSNLQVNQWYHLAWTNLLHHDLRSDWFVYVTTLDGVTQEFSRRSVNSGRRGEGVILPNRTELYLGQNSPNASNHFDMRFAFLGEISHFNVWNETLTKQDILYLSKDDIHRFCGNQIEWSDLRYGTRGNVTLKWPSGIQFGQSFAHGSHDQTQKLVKRLQEACDYNCSVQMGAQCKAGIESNIEWPRTKAGQSTSVACPSVEILDNTTTNSGSALIAFRSCSKNDKQQGVWGDPNYDRCVSLEHLEILNESRTLRSLGHTCQLTLSDMMGLLKQMENLTHFAEYKNPMDLHVMVEGLKNVALAWVKKPCEPLRRLTTNLRELKLLFSTILQIGDNLMSNRNMAAWNLTRHPGQECWHLLSTLHHVYSLYISDLLALKVVQGRCKSQLNCPDGFPMRNMEFSDMFSFFNGENIVVKVTAFNPEKFNGDALPDKDDERKMLQSHLGLGAVGIQVDTFRNSTPAAGLPLLSHDIKLSPTVYITILAMYPFGDRLLPHVHLMADWKKTLGSAARIEDNLNSAIYHVLLFHDSDELSEGLAVPVRTRLKYTNKVNISDIKCVRLSFHEEDTHWTTNNCWLEHEGSDYAQCACNSTGLQGLTTDMYNNKSNKTKDPVKLLAYPSYIGCGVSSVLCFTTCILLTYFRTSTNTAKIHQNFSLAIVCGQLVFVFGIDKTGLEPLCHSMAILIHYFFLASFSWLMNEAFNLYIVITYAAHAHQDGSEEGGMWRYYLIGWIVPIVFVGTFVGINGNSYYAVDMCWTTKENVWLYAGPAIGIVAITVMVLTFTAKEHHESSYTKDEKANKAITIHSKALWTQVILLSVAWSFAFVSIVMHDIIVKLLFAMFNCLQGIFFVVFYFLLNDEVQNKYMQNQKMRLLALHGLHDIAEVEGDQTELRLMQAAEDAGEDGESTGDANLDAQLPLGAAQKWQRQHQLRSSIAAAAATPALTSGESSRHQQLRKRTTAATAAAAPTAPAAASSVYGAATAGSSSAGGGGSSAAGSGEENSDCEMIVTSV